MSDLFLALVHYPVLDRNGRIVTSAITSLDLHDLARSSHTYGVRTSYVVHPIAEQRNFAGSVIDHWRFDFGRSFDSRRREALNRLAAGGAAQAAAGAPSRGSPASRSSSPTGPPPPKGASAKSTPSATSSTAAHGSRPDSNLPDNAFTQPSYPHAADAC